jgi:ferredoxin
MHLSVDRKRCCSSGMCALTAPGVFDQDDEEGRVVLLNPAPPPGYQDAARLAVELCPCEAITEGSAP